MFVSEGINDGGNIGSNCVVSIPMHECLVLAKERVTYVTCWTFSLRVQIFFEHKTMYSMNEIGCSFLQEM